MIRQIPLAPRCPKCNETLPDHIRTCPEPVWRRRALAGYGVNKDLTGRSF